MEAAILDFPEMLKPELVQSEHLLYDEVLYLDFFGVTHRYFISDEGYIYGQKRETGAAASHGYH